MYTVEEIPSVKIVKAINEYAALMYAEQLSVRTRRGMKSMLLQGYLPHRPPLGYEKTMVKGLFRPTKLGLKIGEVLGELAEGELSVSKARYHIKSLVFSRTGKGFSCQQVSRLMRNPYYAGMLCCQGKQYLGKHRPLITIKQHEAILEALRGLTEKPEGN